MTIKQILDIKAMREVYVVWFSTSMRERYFMGEHQHNYCKIKDEAFVYTKEDEAEKRCLSLHDEVHCYEIENSGVDTIRVA